MDTSNTLLLEFMTKIQRTHDKFFVTFSKITKMTLLCLQNRKFVFAQICHNVNYTSQRKMSETVNNDAQYCLQHVKLV